jgi:hypothetical protein
MGRDNPTTSCQADGWPLRHNLSIRPGGLRVTGYELRVTGNEKREARDELRVAGCELRGSALEFGVYVQVLEFRRLRRKSQIPSTSARARGAANPKHQTTNPKQCLNDSNSKLRVRVRICDIGACSLFVICDLELVISRSFRTLEFRVWGLGFVLI